MRAKSISSGSDTKSRLARAERGVLCLLQGPDPTCCSGQEVLARALREAEPDRDTFPLLGGQNQLRGFYPEPRALAGELHSSGVEIRYFKFGWGLFFFLKGLKCMCFLAETETKRSSGFAGKFLCSFSLVEIWGILFHFTLKC